MKRKTPEKYNSILVAVQFKDFLSTIDESLRNTELLKKGGFNVSTVTTLPTIQSLRMRGEVPPAEVSVTPLRIQYREAGVGSEGTKGIFEIIKSLYEERKKMVPESEWDNIDFTGAVVHAVYGLDGNDVEEIKKRFRGRARLDHKRIGLKLNYQDDEGWNYNVEFIFNIARSKLTVGFDINDRYLEQKEVRNLEKILGNINTYLSDPSVLLDLLW